MSETYFNMPLDERRADRAIMLMSLIVTRKLVARSRAFDTDTKTEIMIRLEEMIQDYKQP